MSFKIPVHFHIARDHANNINTTHYTAIPVAPRAAQDHSESRLAGYIIAPNGTEVFATGDGNDVIRMPGDQLPTGLFYAMDYAKRSVLGLLWQPHWQPDLSAA